MNNIHTSIETITPEKASQMLTFNKQNRNISASLLDRLIKSIKTGEWECNGDSIRFDEDGNLLDGQHRLTAISRSGIAVESLVVRGLPKRVFDTIDQGKKRTAGDVLSKAGITNPNVVAAAANLIHAWKTTGNVHLSSLSPSARTIESIVTSEYPELVECALWYRAKKQTRGIFVGGEVVFCKAVFSRANQSKSDSFFDQLDSGANLTEDDPIFLLRNKLIEDKTGVSRLLKHIRIGYYFLAFKLHCKNEKRKTLRFRMNGNATTDIKGLFDLSSVE